MAQEKKKFFEVEVPAINGKIKLIGYKIEEIDNRNIKLDLTRMLRGQGMEAVFKVKVEDGKATAKPIRISAMSFFIRRMMRKSISYVEDSFSAECADSIVRIKPFMITRKKVTRAVRNALRVESKKYIESYVSKMTSESIVTDIVNSRLQKSLSAKMKKIYPLALCEIREFKVEKEKEQVKVEKVAEKPIVKEEVKAEEIKEEVQTEEKK